ncbi:MAG: glycerophosphodiester phosphodiesterase family protein [Persicimonas sp.]
MDLSKRAAARIEVHGHRGAAGLKPENTRPSFEAALDAGVDAIECDVHLSKDERVVVWHDPVLKPQKCRLVDGRGDGPDPDALPTGDERLWVRHLTAEQLSRYRCDRIPDTEKFPRKENGPTPLAGDDYRVMTLEELFDFVEAYATSDLKTERQRDNARRCRFNIEIKRHPGHPEYVADGFDGRSPGVLERRIIELIERRGLHERAFIQSFDARSVRAVRTLDDTVEVALLEKDRTFTFEQMRCWGFQTWTPHHTLADRGAIDEAHIAGIEVIPWTVNDPRRMAELAYLGVDGLITDRPDLIFSEVPRHHT